MLWFVWQLVRVLLWNIEKVGINVYKYTLKFYFIVSAYIDLISHIYNIIFRVC